MITTPPLIDSDVLDTLQYALGEDFGAAIQSFSAEIDQRLIELSSFDDTESANRHYHSIKGTAAAYGATALSALGAQLEARSALTNLSLKEAKAALAQLTECWASTRVLMLAN